LLRLAADENFNNDIVRGLLRRKPDLDIVRVQDVELFALVAFGAMLVLTNLLLLSFLQLKSLDLLFLFRGRLSPAPEIVIVAIDEPSFAEISKQWPWPRSFHARLLEQLNQAGAKVIGFDILFATPSG
jgi:adenylate cyclase